MAKLLVEYSAAIQQGDRVLIEAETPAEPLVRKLFEYILKAGGHPHLLVTFDGMVTMTGMDSTFLRFADDHQIEFQPTFMNQAYEQFESRIRIHSLQNTKSLATIPPEKIRKRAEAIRNIIKTQFTRGQEGDFRWVTTLFPTEAYAQAADMSLEEFEDFVFQANHVDEAEPVAHWRAVGREQEKVIAALNGAEMVKVQGPNCDLSLSIKDRTFLNACGRNNMPDGEIFTGPVEDSVEGWVRFSYPAIYRGRAVSGVELTFEKGKVVKATADKDEEFLLSALDTDQGSRYLGEFAIGTNFGIDKFTGNILFDEKIGGSFHMALGAGYPETGNTNESAIHWDMICDMKTDSEIVVDGETFYKNGKFTL
jgi:aminopeptidase